MDLPQSRAKMYPLFREKGSSRRIAGFDASSLRRKKPGIIVLGCRLQMINALRNRGSSRRVDR